MVVARHGGWEETADYAVRCLVAVACLMVKVIYAAVI